MKKALGIILIISMLAAVFSYTGFAAQSSYVAMYVNVPVAVINGNGAAIDESSEVSPYIKNNRAMLPVRFVAESLGAEVGWEAESRTVTVSKAEIVLSMAIGESVMYKNGQAITLDAPAEIAFSRTMVPVRAVAEGLDMNVVWNDGLICISEDENAQQTAIADAERLCMEYNIMPLALNISWGGQILKDFNPMVNTYTIRPENPDLSKIHISVIADEFSEASVSMPETIPGEIKVTVRGKVFSGLENVYTIRVKEPAPFKVSARSSQAGNGPENTFDEDFSTRWAAEGNQWIMYEFHEPAEISKVKIAFWKASETRKASLNIQVKQNREDKWITVFKGNSTYSTEELEAFEFEKQTVKYVRISGFGNTENKWNSILEVRFE